MLNHIHSLKSYNTATRLNYVQQCMKHPHISCEALQSLLFPTFNRSLETPNRNPHVDGVAHSPHTHNLSKWYGDIQYIPRNMHTVFALLCFVVVIHWLMFPYPSGVLHWHCGNLTIAPSASKATLMNMDKYFMWIHYERLHNHNKAKHNKTVCIFLGIYCTSHHTIHNMISVL